MSRRTAELLFNAMVECDQDSAIIALLRTIKEQYSVIELGEEFFLQLQKIAAQIEDKRTRAALIEAMVEFPYFNFDYEVLDEYLTLVSDYETSDDDAIRCLGSFVIRNFYKEVIFLRIAQFSDKQRALKILVEIGETEWEGIPPEYQQFVEEVRTAIRVSNRVFIISQFLYFVHPFCGAYSNISNLVPHYPSIESAINDWAWRLPVSTEHIINSKIVTSREAEVFIKLGQLLYEKVHLTPVEKAGLYSAFFEGKDPIDVIFNLP